MLKIKNGYIEIPYKKILFPKSNITVESFFTLNDNTEFNDDTILSCTQAGGYVINFYDTGKDKLAFLIYNNNSYTRLGLDISLLKKINRLTYVFSSTHNILELYLNNKKIQSQSIDDVIEYPSGCNLIIGSEYCAEDNSYKQFKNGEILCCRVWKKALTEKDIIDYSHMDKIDNDDLVGNWIMSDKYIKDKKLIDLSKYHNDGNIVGDVTIDNNTYNIFRRYLLTTSNTTYYSVDNTLNKLILDNHINFQYMNNINDFNNNIKDINSNYSIIYG